MIERYVIMKFREEEIENFLKIFHDKKNKIAGFNGCEHLELRQSCSKKNWLMTFSIWKQESFLEEYRKSDLFDGVWNKVKPLFSEKAEAITIFPNQQDADEKRTQFLSKFEN